MLDHRHRECECRCSARTFPRMSVNTIYSRQKTSKRHSSIGTSPKAHIQSSQASIKTINRNPDRVIARQDSTAVRAVLSPSPSQRKLSHARQQVKIGHYNWPEPRDASLTDLQVWLPTSSGVTIAQTITIHGGSFEIIARGISISLFLVT